MLRHLLNSTRKIQSIATSGTGVNHVAAPEDECSYKAAIDGLFSQSRSGLWGLLIFLAASALAFNFRDHTLSGSMPGDLMAQLGPTPDVILVNIVLGVSTFCSLIIIAGRIYNERCPSNTWTHMWFRLFFYLLYFIASSLNDYFNVVFISGLVVLTFQHYNVWNYYSRLIETKMNKWDSLHTCGKGFSR